MTELFDYVKNLFCRIAINVEKEVRMIFSHTRNAYKIMIFVCIVLGVLWCYIGFYQAYYNISKNPVTAQEQFGDRTWMKNMELKYHEDNQRIKLVCKKHNLKPKNFPFQFIRKFPNLLSDRRHGLLGCVLPKIGTTTLKTHFYNMIPNQKRKMLDLDPVKRLYWTQNQPFGDRYFQVLIFLLQYWIVFNLFN